MFFFFLQQCQLLFSCQFSKFFSRFLIMYNIVSLQLQKQLLSVFSTIHILNNIPRLLLKNPPINFLHQHFLNFRIMFKRIFAPQIHFQQLSNSILNLALHKPKFLVIFIPQNLPKNSDIIVLLRKFFYSINNSSCPLYNKPLQPVLLIQISVHVLFHRLSRQFSLQIFLVVFLLRIVNFFDYFF